MLIIAIYLFLLWLLQVNPSSFLILSLLHPINHLLHSLLPLPLILIDVDIDIVVSGPELSSYDLFNLFFILQPDVFKVLTEGCLLIFFIEVDCVVDEFYQVCVQVHSLVFLLLFCVVDVFDHVVVLLVV